MCHRFIYSDWDSFPTDYEVTKERLEATSKPIVAFIVGSTRQVLNIGRNLVDCLNRLNRAALYEWSVESDELTGYEQTEDDSSEIVYRVWSDDASLQIKQKITSEFKSGRLDQALLNRYTKKIGLEVAELV